MNFDYDTIFIKDDEILTESLQNIDSPGLLKFIKKLHKSDRVIFKWYTFRMDNVETKKNARHFSLNFETFEKYWNNPSYIIGIDELSSLKKIKINQLW